MEIESSSQEISYSLQDTVATEHHLWSVECERLWHRIKDVQNGLENLPAQKAVETVDGESQSATDTALSQSEDQVYRLLQEYEKRLKAELAFLHGNSVDGITTSNKEVEYLVLQQDQRKQKQHLKESLSHVKAKHSSLVDDIEQEENMNTMLKKVQDALKIKNDAISQSASTANADDSDHSTSHDTEFADLRAKVKKLKQVNKHFQDGLKDLLSSFPSPSTSSTKNQRRKTSKNALDNTRDFGDNDFMSLSSIVGKLMEKALNTPEQPYVDISTNMWPQHIEFLLRSQIVLKDPENSSRMKLVPFHL